MHKILYIQALHPAGMEYLALKPGYNVVVSPDTQRKTLEKEIIDAEVIISRMTVIDANLIDCGKQLRAVCKHGVGTDNIDVAHCHKNGIEIITTGDANSSTVAEQAMLAIGALFRRMPWLDRRIREGDWSSRDRACAVDLMGHSIGIAGFGRIGKCLARIALNGFQMDVHVYDPFSSERDVKAANCTWHKSLESMLSVCDALSLHVPLTKNTHGMIDEKRIAMMPNGAVLANFSRGGIVDETALYNALISGHLSGAALDVFQKEPIDSTSPLLTLENVILSPHCATFTEDSRRRMSMRIANEIVRVLGD